MEPDVVTSYRSACRGPARRQQGVVLFVALIGMVVLALAAVALMRAVDAGTSIAGNLAFKQASIGPINHAVEAANYALFEAPAAQRITDPYNHLAAKNYYANLQAGEVKGIPAGLYGPSYSYPSGFETFTDPVTGYEVRWVIERMCQGTGPAPGPFFGDPLSEDGLQACDLLVPKVSPGGTANEVKDIIVLPSPLYRVTIRVDGPANTVTYAQAILR